MSWEALLANEGGREVVSAWLGGRSVRVGPRAWRLHGPLPPEPGWYRFRERGRKVELVDGAEPAPDLLVDVQVGFLIGDRLCPESSRVSVHPSDIAKQLERVGLVPPEVERFARIQAGRMGPGAPLVFSVEEMPLGPELAVATAFLDHKASVDDIPEVSPALDAAFRLESTRRDAAERRREAQRRAAEAEARRAALLERHGDGARRRAMAAVDFRGAATAALAVGGARYRDHRRGAARHEMVVRFVLDGARYECSCDARTLRIIDAGICLVDHVTDERGDDYFTLESLPGVIRQAEREGALVVFRHLG